MQGILQMFPLHAQALTLYGSQESMLALLSFLLLLLHPVHQQLRGRLPLGFPIEWIDHITIVRRVQKSSLGPKR
jgi:hypothetical protein